MSKNNLFFLIVLASICGAVRYSQSGPSLSYQCLEVDKSKQPVHCKKWVLRGTCTSTKGGMCVVKIKEGTTEETCTAKDGEACTTKDIEIK